MTDKCKKDLYRYTASIVGCRPFIRALMIPGFRYTYILRKAAVCHKRSIIGILFRLLHRHYSYKYGFQIPVITDIGEGLYIGHFGTIIINSRTMIGKNCNISPGVVIGQISQGSKKGTPRIGDFVWIGSNSVIVGNITIGSNVVVAPGTYVNFNVPDNSCVIGNPGVIHYKLNPTEGLINKVES